MGIDSSLRQRLIQLECSLHDNELRQDEERLASLLHPEFVEIGRSGLSYSRDQILAEFREEAPLPVIHSDSFEANQLADGLVLLRYRSAHIAEDGTLHRWTLRGSLWIQEEAAWQIRFHQGTPASGKQE